MKLILLGAPGSGKGTTAKLLSQKYKIPQISTGDILRNEIRDKTILGIKIEKQIAEGTFVSDEDMIMIINKRLAKEDTKKGFILDGFPRTAVQADELEKITKLDAVVNLFVDNETLIKRLLGRRSCPKCRKEYNMETVMITKSGKEICDVCGVKLTKRADDNEESIRKRMEIYNNETKPLIDYYKKKGILKEVEGTGTPEEVAEKVVNVL